MLVVEANRFEGGIWLFWDDSRITLEVVTMMDQMISMLVKDQWEKPWLLSIVYASLKHIPWVVMDDINQSIDMDKHGPLNQNMANIH